MIDPQHGNLPFAQLPAGAEDGTVAPQHNREFRVELAEILLAITIDDDGDQFGMPAQQRFELWPRRVDPGRTPVGKDQQPQGAGLHKREGKWRMITGNVNWGAKMACPLL
jgi:hypothetical protein